MQSQGSVPLGPGSVPTSAEAQSAGPAAASHPADPRLDPELTFAKLLQAHVDLGTGLREPGRWKHGVLAEFVGLSDRQIRNWLGKSGSLPGTDPDHKGDPSNSDSSAYGRLLEVFRVRFLPNTAGGKLVAGAEDFARVLDAALKKSKDDRALEREARSKQPRPAAPISERKEHRTAGSSLRHALAAIAAEQTALFTGRSHELNQIHAALAANASGASSATGQRERLLARPVVIRGMPGVGKSSLAREYLLRHGSDYDRVHMFRAEERGTLIDDLARLAINEKVAAEDLPHEAAARQVMDRIAASKQRWLLVFDNAADTGFIGDLWPAEHVAMIITTRWADWKRTGATVIELRELVEAEAVQFLLSRSGQTDAPGAHRLYRALGGVALALEQAGALCSLEEGGTSFGMCVEQISRVIDHEQPGVSASERSVSVTLLLAMRAASARCPAAPEVLTLAAFCDPAGIPGELLSAVMRHGKAAQRALSTLRALSLIGLDSSDGKVVSVSVHRLVQHVARQWARRDGTESAAVARIAAWLLAEFPKKGYEDARCWPRCAVLAPHAMRVWELKGAQVPGVDVCQLMDRVAMYYLGTSQEKSEIERADRQLGSNLEIAERLCREVLARRDVFGFTDSSALALSLSNLALLLHYKGELDESLDLCKRALAIRESTGDPLLAWSVNNLASLKLDRGELDEALAGMTRALQLTIADPELTRDEWATAYDNLGDVLLRMGRIEEALANFNQGLEYRVSFYGGSDHSDVAYSKFHIAKAKLELGELLAAIDSCDEALSTYRRCLGGDHIDSAEVLEFAGDLRLANSQEEHAEEFYRSCIAVFDSAGWLEHPDAASPCRKLADLLTAQGNLREAIELRRRAKGILTLSSGVHSPETITASVDLVDALLRAHRPDEALGIAVDAQEKLQVLLGAGGASESSAGAELRQRLAHLIRSCGDALSRR